MSLLSSASFCHIKADLLEVVEVVETVEVGYDDDDYVGAPTLWSFGMIDSFGTNSDFEDTHLALSPYVNDGQFEVFWDVESRDDYFVELRINDQPNTNGSRLITSESCGPFNYCDDHQYQFCDYDSDYSIQCETPNGNIQTEWFDDYIYEQDQDLFMILQVCDSSFFYCEYQTKTVLMK